MSHKNTLRIPTSTQYGYVELEVGETPVKDLKAMYDEYLAEFQSENKYSETTFNEMICKVMDSDLTDWQITTEEYANLTESQQKVYQSIKRFRKRLPEDNE